MAPQTQRPNRKLKAIIQMSVVRSQAQSCPAKRRLISPLRAMPEVEPIRAVGVSQTKRSSVRCSPLPRQSRRPFLKQAAIQAPPMAARLVAAASRRMIKARSLRPPRRARAPHKAVSSKRRGGHYGDLPYVTLARSPPYRPGDRLKRPQLCCASGYTNDGHWVGSSRPAAIAECPQLGRFLPFASGDQGAPSTRRRLSARSAKLRPAPWRRVHTVTDRRTPGHPPAPPGRVVRFHYPRSALIFFRRPSLPTFCRNLSAVVQEVRFSFSFVPAFATIGV